MTFFFFSIRKIILFAGTFMRDGRGRVNFFPSIFFLLFTLFQRRFKACAMYILDTLPFFYFFCPGLIGDVLVRGCRSIVLCLHHHMQYIEGGRPLLDSFISRLPNLHDFKRGTRVYSQLLKTQRRISLDLAILSAETERG